MKTIIGFSAILVLVLTLVIVLTVDAATPKNLIIHLPFEDLLRKFRVKRPAYLLFICIFQLAIISCTTNEEEISKIIKEIVENPNFIPLSEFEINKSRWQASNLNNYQFDFRWICFCEHDYISPATITVEDGTINSAIYTETQIPVHVNKLDRYKIIDGLFSFIQDAYDKNAYQISINYDPHDGYPFEGSVDYVEMMVDEEKGFEISNLMKLKSDENGIWLIGKLPKAFQLWLTLQ